MQIRIAFSDTDLKTIQKLKKKVQITSGREFSDDEIIEAIVESILVIGVELKPAGSKSRIDKAVKVYDVMLAGGKDFEQIANQSL